MSVVEEVKTLLFTGYGINSEAELAECFRRAGSTQVDLMHINDVIRLKHRLSEYDIIGLAGGFSYGDHLGSGRIFANKIKKHFWRELIQFITLKKPVIGICNGFQVLACLGILPFSSGQLRDVALETDLPPSPQTLALIRNKKGRFENRWIYVAPNANNDSLWLRDLPSCFPLPVRHGEGRCVFASKDILDRVKQAQYVAFQYCDDGGVVTMDYPQNPNGSTDSIAALTNEEGNVLGLMPHPEVFMIREQYPLWKREQWEKKKEIYGSMGEKDGLGMLLFYNAVRYVREGGCDEETS